MPRIISLWRYTIDPILQSNSSNSQSKFSFPLGLCSCSKGISPQVPAVSSDSDHHDHHDYYDSGNDVPLKFSYIQHGIMYPTLSWDLLPKCMKELSPTWAGWVDTDIFFIVISDLIWVLFSSMSGIEEALWRSLHTYLYWWSFLLHFLHYDSLSKKQTKLNDTYIQLAQLEPSVSTIGKCNKTKYNHQGPGLIPGA